MALFITKKSLLVINDKEIDIIVWGCRDYPNALRNPEMYGWISYKIILFMKFQ